MTSGRQTYAGPNSQQAFFNMAGASGSSAATPISLDDETQTATNQHPEREFFASFLAGVFADIKIALQQGETGMPQPPNNIQQSQQLPPGLSEEDQPAYAFAMREDWVPAVVTLVPDPEVPGGMRETIRLTTFGEEFTHLVYLRNDPAVLARWMENQEPGGPQYVGLGPPLPAGQAQNAFLTDAELMPPPPVPRRNPGAGPPSESTPVQASASAPTPDRRPTAAEAYAVSVPPQLRIRERVPPSQPWQDTQIHDPYDPNANQGPRRPETAPPARPAPVQVPRARHPRFARILDRINDQLRRASRHGDRVTSNR
jgi:hypothetical protein